MENKTIKREYFTAEPLRLREREDGTKSRTITGYAIVFNQESACLYEDDKHAVREVIASSAVPRELLDASDFVLTMFHNNQLILGRAKHGSGTLKYDVDDHGVKFECDMPETADGDKAIELVERGDIDGCSFAFSTEYWDPDFVSRAIYDRNGIETTVCTVERITGIYDMTLTPNPAYPQTECANRELAMQLREIQEAERSAQEPAPAEAGDDTQERERKRRQVAEMRETAAKKFV